MAKKVGGASRDLDELKQAYKQKLNDVKKLVPAKEKEVVRRPERPDAVVQLVDEVSLSIKLNVAAIIDAESEYEFGLNKNRLRKLMGWKSAIIYPTLNPESDVRIGVDTLCRFALAMNVPPHVLVIPHERFKTEFLSGYKKALAAGEINLALREEKIERSAKKGK